MVCVYKIIYRLQHYHFRYENVDAWFFCIILYFHLKVFYGTGFYGGTGSHVNDSYDNAGYGLGGISWLTHTSVNQTNLFENNAPSNPNFGTAYNPNQNYLAAQGNNKRLFFKNKSIRSFNFL